MELFGLGTSQAPNRPVGYPRADQKRALFLDRRGANTIFASILLVSALSIEHFPRRAEGKVNVRSDFAAFRRVHRALFLDRQGEKPSVAKSMNSSCLSDSMMASPSTGRGERSSQAHVLAFQSQRSIVFYDVLKAFFSKRGFEHGAVQKAFPACMPMKMALWTQRELANFGARKK